MRQLWIGFIAVIIVSFAILGWAGFRIYQEKPPVPRSVITTEGKIMIPVDDIEKGQEVWRSIGGMEIGSVWGHGSYVAPDWSADWLHREAVFILNEWSQKGFGRAYDRLGDEDKARLRARLTDMMRRNTYDQHSGNLVLDPVRQRAFAANRAYYSAVFVDGSNAYSIPPGSLTDSVQLRQLSAFFFWTSWAASTNRPGEDISYTSNWPHEDLVGNIPTADAILWTGVSIILLLAGIGGMIWYHASKLAPAEKPELPANDPMLAGTTFPSQRATVKYFWVVSVLFLVQILLGVVTAHYGVEGNAFYGIPLSQWLPYSVARTWHTQLGIFWIATAWLAAGLYLAPAVSGSDLKGQRFGVNFLFIALLIIVVGSLAGEWLSVFRRLPGDLWYYFGHQGYEYVDLGRVWQIGLIVGLALWVFLVGRNIYIGLKKPSENRSLLVLFLIATVAIGAFYLAGLMYGQKTNLAVAEYWRWWVVHLWVEGFFEVFATVVIAYLFSRLKLVRASTAGASVVFSSIIFLSGGIVGTLHHLYFSGTPTAVLALGSVFSALEVVPLVLVGYEAWDNIRRSGSLQWVRRYRWPIYFFISVAFWNMVGAGLFGFMINPPIALYYMQGLNTTPLHGHAALFGVYGMLGIGLMLFCLRVLWVQNEWKEKMLRVGFWALNIGLMAMVCITLLPVGLLQTWASVKYGYWFARSPEFLHSPALETIKWTRVAGDTIFTVGAIAVVFFVFGLVTGHSLKKQPLERS